MTENWSDALTVEDAAAHLGVTVRTVRRYIATGRLPILRLSPRRIRITRADLDALVQEEQR